jgi:hypothetical protein
LCLYITRVFYSGRNKEKKQISKENLTNKIKQMKERGKEENKQNKKIYSPKFNLIMETEIMGSLKVL